MATKKKELLEQEAPVTETVMSEGETLPADTAQPESLPADAGDGLDLNELLGQMDQPPEDTSAEDMAEDPLPELTEEEMFGDTPAETDDQSAAPTDMPEDSDVQVLSLGSSAKTCKQKSLGSKINCFPGCLLSLARHFLYIRFLTAAHYLCVI